MVLLVLHQYIGAADLLAPIYWCCKHFKKNPQNLKICKMLVFLCLLVLQALFHQFIGATMLVAPIYWWFLHCSTNILVQTNGQNLDNC
jgi:hypothetical protein